MIKKLLFLVFLIGLISCNQSKNSKQDNSGIITTDLTQNEIPKSIEIKGDLIIAKKWTDKNGENILVVSRKGPLEETEYEVEFLGDEKYAELYGVQYVKDGDSYRILWDIYDFERHCPFDLWIGLLPNSTRITDLDNDSITETTLIYKLTCRSDVSPSNMKLLMHENNIKMGLRGLMILEMDKGRINENFEPDLSKIDTTGLSDMDLYIELYGRYNNENDFKDKPKEFLEFAKSLWLEFVDKDEFLQF